MNIPKRGEFYKDVYRDEIGERKGIDTRIRLALTVFVLLTSASVPLVEKILRLILNPDVILSTWSLLVIAFGIVTFAYLCYCIYRGLVGWKYHKIPLPELAEYYDRLIKYYEKYRSELGQQRVESMIRESYEEKLVECFVECAEHNQGINQRRANRYAIVSPPIVH